MQITKGTGSYSTNFHVRSMYLWRARQIYGTKWYHYKRINAYKGVTFKHASFIELAKGEEIETKYRFRHEDMQELHAEIANIA